MGDRPILFSAPMVRALLDGRKTQTRRTIRSRGSEISMQDSIRIMVGDRLWVREAFRGSKGYDKHPPRTWSHWPVHYEADGDPDPNDELEENGRLRPGIHMPRWMSRLTLTVTGVRAERLQEITREDAIAEGLVKMSSASAVAIDMGCDWGFDGDTRHGSPVSAYAALWDFINGAGAWNTNPWVVAYTFTVQRGNIDQIGRAAA